MWNSPNSVFNYQPCPLLSCYLVFLNCKYQKYIELYMHANVVVKSSQDLRLTVEPIMSKLSGKHIGHYKYNEDVLNIMF